MSSLFVESHQLPITLTDSIPKPIPDSFDTDCIIISTDYQERSTTPGIYNYNTRTNKLEIIYKYDEHGTFQGENHGQFVDPSNNSLILYGGTYQIFQTFDFNTKNIKPNQTTNIISKCHFRPQHAYIPAPMNQIHIMDYDCNHFIFDITNKETTKAKTNSELKLHDIWSPKLVFIKSQLFIFGGDDNNKIFSYNDNNNNIWNVNKLQMPYQEHSNYYDMLDGFQNILIILYFHKQEIYILDLIKMNWVKSKCTIPNEFMNNNINNMVFAMKINDNIHIMDFEFSIHFKVNVFNIIPCEIIVSHRKHFKPLIMQYVREKENDFSLQPIPLVLKLVILNYFQLF